LLFSHNLQRLALPEWLRVKSKEGISSGIIRELDEDRALEQLLWSATKANRVGGTIWGKESFNVKLRARLLVTKTFGVDGSRLGLGARGIRVVWLSAFNFFKTFWTSNFEEVAVSERSNNRTNWFEASHTTESTDCFNFDWQVVSTISGVPQVLVSRKVAVAKVKLDLFATMLDNFLVKMLKAYLIADQLRIIGLRENRGIIFVVLAWVLEILDSTCLQNSVFVSSDTIILSLLLCTIRLCVLGLSLLSFTGGRILFRLHGLIFSGGNRLLRLCVFDFRVRHSGCLQEPF
jgi:hypothetical protein